MIRTTFKLAKVGSHLLLLRTSLRNPVLLRQLEIAVNKQLQHQPATHPILEQLQQKSMNIAIPILGLEWHITFVKEQLLVNQGLNTKGNAQITIKLAQVPRQLFTSNVTQAIECSGDFTTLAQFRELVRTSKLDLYPGLVRIFGIQTGTLIADILDTTGRFISDRLSFRSATE